MCVFSVCVQACMSEVCAGLSECTLAVCLRGCVYAHVCLHDGGGGRAWIKHTRSTSERLGGPSPAPMATHVNPTNQKIGQWNTTHSHTQTDIHTCTSINSKNHSLPVAPVPCRPSATHVQHRHAHLPSEQTRPLDWNNRIKNGAERKSDTSPPPLPSLYDPLPPFPACYLVSTPKKLLLWSSGAALVRDVARAKITPAVVSTAPHTTVAVRETHTENNF